MVVGDKAQPKGAVQMRTLPESTYAVTLHAGPPNEIGRTYAQLLAQVASALVDGRRWLLGDPPSLERDPCDPRKVSPQDMRTEICMPVHPASAPVTTSA